MPDKENNNTLSSLSDVDLLKQLFTMDPKELLKNKAILPRLKSIIEVEIKKHSFGTGPHYISHA